MHVPWGYFKGEELGDGMMDPGGGGGVGLGWWWWWCWAVRGSERPRNVYRSQSVMVSLGAHHRAVRPPHSERERGEGERDFWLDC